MNLEELQAWASRENARLVSHYGLEDERVRALAKMVKLTEETGELADEVLARFRLQRASKLEGRGEDDLAKEVADVMLAAATLADLFGVDIEKAIGERMGAIDARDYKG